MFQYLQNLECGLKISLEDEGLTLDQACFITSCAHKHNYSVTVKVGGAEAISDMRIANNLGVEGIQKTAYEIGVRLVGSEMCIRAFLST